MLLILFSNITAIVFIIIMILKNIPFLVIQMYSSFMKSSNKTILIYKYIGMLILT